MTNYFRKIAECYKSSVPIDDPDMFVGRLEQKSLLLRTLFTPGRHALVYGARGIGKTSLINITTRIFQMDSELSYETITHTCSYGDTYSSIMFSILNSAGLNNSTTEKIKYSGKGSAGFNIPYLVNATTEGGIEREIDKEKILDTVFSPDLFCKLICERNLLIVLEEFERVSDVDTITLFSETLKILSDTSSTSKFILSCVANNSQELFSGHLSINRSLINIELPLMSSYELTEIINYGAKRLNIEFDENILKIIIWLSDGMPFFTHLLAEELAANVLFENEKIITGLTLKNIIGTILKSRTYEIINQDYESIINAKRGFFELNPLTDHSLMEYQQPAIRKLILHAFSFLSTEQEDFVYDTLSIAKLFYSDKIQLYNINEEDFIPGIETTLDDFAKKNTVLTFRGNDNYVFTDNFYKTFIRLKAISEIHHHRIRQLEEYFDSDIC